MNSDTLEFIKSLSKNDKKNLTQKTLKLMEESGELAKNVLPYELASGTLHKFVHKDQIMENAVDNILVSLSIIYSLDYSDDEIDEMMNKKSLYWSQLQQNEINLNPEKIPHEIHVTVAGVDNLEAFKEVCKLCNVKPIVLDLHVNATDSIKDIMTSSVFFGPSSEAFNQMQKIRNSLFDNGYNVVRGKIEVAPWHPAVPNEINKFKHEDKRYFESHIEVYVDNTPASETSLEDLYRSMEGNDVYISKNYFKRDGDVSTIMLTYRKYDGTLEKFKNELAELRSLITNSGFVLNGK